MIDKEKLIHPMCKDCNYLHHDYYNCQGEKGGCFEWDKIIGGNNKDWRKTDDYKKVEYKS